MTSSIYGKHSLDKLGTSFLAVDVGNTSIHFAFYSHGRFGKEFRVSTKDVRLAVAMIRKNNAIAPAVIASVVPKVGQWLKKEIYSKLSVPAYLIGKDLPVPVVNKYKNPKQVGIDRLLNALAAHHDHPRELVIIDFGTAITFDVVSKKGEYLGGVIAPGIEISLEALFQKTALLPRIHLEHPKNLIGRDTIESIRVGCSTGIGGLCDRVVEAISRQYKMKPYVVATGGYAKFMSRYCRSFCQIDPLLIMKGIRLTYLKKSA